MAGLESGEKSARRADPELRDDRRGFTRYVQAAQEKSERRTRRPVFSRRIHAPQSEPLDRDAFVEEIDDWIEERTGDALARMAEMRRQATDEPLVARRDDAPEFDAIAPENKAGKAPGNKAGKALGASRLKRTVDQDDLRFEADADAFDDTLYDAGEDDALEFDPDDYSDAAAVDAVQGARAYGGRVRSAVLFAGACVAAMAALSYSVQQTLGGLETSRISTATIPTAATRPTPPSWTDRFDWSAEAPDAEMSEAETSEAGTSEAETPDAAAANDDAMTRATDRPAPAPIETGSIATKRHAVAIGSSDVVSPYLGARELKSLLTARPVKCVLSLDDARRAQLFGSANDQAFGYGGDGCETATDYNLSTGRFIRRSEIAKNATLEISARFSLDGERLCHDFGNVSVLVLGDGLPFSEAFNLEERVKDGYARRGETVCYRIRDLSSTLGEHAYRADVFVNGVHRPERSDPRPFLMRPRF